MIASRIACALVSTASVATRPIVVLVPRPPFTRSAVSNDAGRPRPPNSPFRSNGAAQKCGPVPIVGAPTAFTATIAATVWPLRM